MVADPHVSPRANGYDRLSRLGDRIAIHPVFHPFEVFSEVTMSVFVSHDDTKGSEGVHRRQ